MERTAPKKPLIGRGSRRKAIQLSKEPVEIGPLLAGKGLPFLVKPNVKGMSLAVWGRDNRERIAGLLAEHGGVLFRGFAETGLDGLEEVFAGLGTELLEYKERSSPRSQVKGSIYTSTDYPPEHEIFLHNENSYQSAWPLRICFFCLDAADEGGATPIADCRRIYERVDPEVRKRFAERGWMYVRNFGERMGLPWQTVFGTDDKARVDEYCASHGIETEWRDGDHLRTRAVRRAVARHPKTGEWTWFNHATFFHVSTLEPAVRELLERDFDEADLPTNTYYGDGSPIEPEVLDELRNLYREETVRFPWQRGDFLLLDNMLVAHGREPFTGSRKVVVAMAEPCSWEEIEQ